MDGLTRLAHLIVLLAVVVGPLVAWLLLLNRRDRREGRVHTALSRVLHAPDLDERLAVQVRCGVLSPRCVARVYFSALSVGEFWAFGTRLARIVPRHVRLVLDGTIDARAPASVRAEVVNVATLPGAPRAPLRWKAFSLRPVVGLHLEGASDEEVWRAIRHFSLVLPRHARLVVATAGHPPLAWAVKVCTAPPDRPAESSRPPAHPASPGAPAAAGSP